MHMGKTKTDHSQKFDHSVIKSPRLHPCVISHANVELILGWYVSFGGIVIAIGQFGLICARFRSKQNGLISLQCETK